MFIRGDTIHIPCIFISWTGFVPTLGMLQGLHGSPP